MTHLRRQVLAVCLCAVVVALGVAAWGQSGAGQKTAPGTVSHAAPEPTVADKADGDGLVIWPVELPDTYPRATYLVNLQGHGNYVPVLHWRVDSGALPPGIKLDDNGTLQGEAERAGEFQFVVSAKDGGKPQQVVQRAFVIKVVEAITLRWKVPAHVNVSRIEGSVEISNTTADDMDLTFDVKAVAENGRATEIGYQRFPLKKGTIAMTLPFGEALPHGAYVVYDNVNGEVAKWNAVYRRRMQTDLPLQVTVGP